MANRRFRLPSPRGGASCPLPSPRLLPSVRLLLVLLLSLLVAPPEPLGCCAAEDHAETADVDDDLCVGSDSDNSGSSRNGKNSDRKGIDGDLLDRCRRFPTWVARACDHDVNSGSDSSSNLMDECPTVTGYRPPNLEDLLGSAEEEYSDPHHREWYDAILACLDHAAADLARAAGDGVGHDSSSSQCPNNGDHHDSTPKVDPPKITGLYPSPQNAVMATVEFVLTEEEAESVKMLAWCLRYHHPHQFERRGFEYTEAEEENEEDDENEEDGKASTDDDNDDASTEDEADGNSGDDDSSDDDDDDPDESRGGNDVTFLAGFLQLFAPGVSAQVYTIAHLVWDAAGWANVTLDGLGDAVEYPDPYKTGLRTSEHLSYAQWGSLGEHTDAESLYTVLVALADPNEYEGGEFYIRPKSLHRSDFIISLRPRRLTAIVFLSEEAHGVGSIAGGRREMFTNELWAYDDVALGILRPKISDYLERISR